VNFGLRLALFPVLGQLLTQPLMHAGTHILMRVGVGGSAPIEPEEIALSAARNAAPGTGRAFHRTVAGCMDLSGQRVQTWDRIHEVDSLPPLALFWGERDRILPIGHGLGAEKRIGGAAFYRYPRAGHFVHLEETEAFTGDLLGFLGSKDPEPARIIDEALLARWHAARARR